MVKRLQAKMLPTKKRIMQCNHFEGKLIGLRCSNLNFTSPQGILAGAIFGPLRCPVSQEKKAVVRQRNLLKAGIMVNTEMDCHIRVHLCSVEARKPKNSKIQSWERC